MREGKGEGGKGREREGEREGKKTEMISFPKVCGEFPTINIDGGDDNGAAAMLDTYIP